jgi:hypothetical protein
MVTCLHCKAQFEPNPQSVRRLGREPKFCSRECGRTWRRNGSEVPCTQCGTPVYRRKSHQALTRLPFCGFECYGLWQQTHHRETRTDVREWRKQAQLARDRDGNRCVDCGQTKKRLVVHHIVEREPGKPDNHALDNLVTLCDGCHRRRH